MPIVPRGPLKPPVRVRSGAILRARDGYALGPRAEEEVFRLADVMSEGRLDGAAFYGSTLLTIDLERVAPELRGPTGEGERLRLLEAAAGSVRVRLRAMRVAFADVARRYPDRDLGTATVETSMRLEGTRLLIDVDLEVPVSVSSRAGEPAR
jgi:hypothetical protein